MGNSVIVYPTENYASSATVTATSGAFNSTYPGTYANNLNPSKPVKMTGTSGTIRFTFGSSTTLAAIALINHNLAGATVQLSNGAGMATQTVTIPSNTSDGQCINPFKDFSSASNRASTTWDLAISGATSPIAIGEVVLANQLRDLLWRWELEADREYLVITHETFGGSSLKYNKRIRRRGARSSGPRINSVVHTLHQGAQGSVNPFLFILDNSINDAMFVQLTDKLEWTHYSRNHVEGRVAVREVSSGPPLF